jgi:hypothetical protein
MIAGAFFAAATIFTSCQKEAETSNTVTYQANPVNFTSSVGASVSGSGLLVEASSNSSITWSEGILNIGEIDFEARKDGSQIEYKYSQLVNVDISKAAAALGSIQIPDGTYDEVKLKLLFRKSSTDDIPARLKGSYTDLSGAKTPVELQFNEDLEIQVEAENLVMEANSHIARINMHLNKLLSRVTIADLTMATKTNGTIVISSTSNAALYAKIKASLEGFADCRFED